MRRRNFELSRWPLLSVMAVGTMFLQGGCFGGSSDTPDTAPVEGVVTMDGQPLPNASVQFLPVGGEEGRPSFGYTDAEGHYELQYSSTADGAVLGEHLVKISTFSAGETDEYGGVSPPTEETVPAKYNQNSELKRTVKADDYVFNFDLSSEGEIYNPLEDPGYSGEFAN